MLSAREGKEVGNPSGETGPNVGQVGTGLYGRANLWAPMWAVHAFARFGVQIGTRIGCKDMEKRRDVAWVITTRDS